MKLKNTYITRKNDGDYVMMDSSGEFAGIIHSNATTEFIAECLKTETTKEEIVQKMLEKYDASEREVLESINMIIDKLRSIGAIDE